MYSLTKFYFQTPSGFKGVKVPMKDDDRSAAFLRALESLEGFDGIPREAITAAYGQLNATTRGEGAFCDSRYSEPWDVETLSIAKVEVTYAN